MEGKHDTPPLWMGTAAESVHSPEQRLLCAFPCLVVMMHHSVTACPLMRPHPLELAACTAGRCGAKRTGVRRVLPFGKGVLQPTPSPSSTPQCPSPTSALQPPPPPPAPHPPFSQCLPYILLCQCAQPSIFFYRGLQPHRCGRGRFYLQNKGSSAPSTCHLLPYYLRARVSHEHRSAIA